MFNQTDYIDHKDKYFKADIEYECPICKYRFSSIQILKAQFNFSCPSCGSTNILQYMKVKENKQEK